MQFWRGVPTQHLLVKVLTGRPLQVCVCVCVCSRCPCTLRLVCPQSVGVTVLCVRPPETGSLSHTREGFLCVCVCVCVCVLTLVPLQVLLAHGVLVGHVGEQALVLLLQLGDLGEQVLSLSSPHVLHQLQLLQHITMTSSRGAWWSMMEHDGAL